MTPSLVRCLAAYRELCAKLGRAPIIRELAAALDIRNESAQRALEKLTIEGYELPMSNMIRLKGRLHSYKLKPKSAPFAAREAQKLIDLLREADVILSCICVNDRPRRDQWRSKAAVYLNGEKS